MGKLSEITGMRGFAAFYVLAFHALIVYGSSGLKSPEPASAPLFYGWIGVDFFFVLSGFLLALPLLASRSSMERPGFWRRYVTKRWWRIAPPYYLSIPVALALTAQLGYLATNPGDVFLHVFFLHSFTTETLASINGVYWTLASEFQFYLLLPLFVIALRGRRWLLSLIAIAGITLAWRGMTYHDHAWLSFTLPAFLFHFSIGILAARAYASGWKPRIAPSLAGLAAIGLLVVLPLHVWGARLDQGSHTVQANLWLRTVLALGFAAIILLVASQDSVARRAFRSKPVTWMGEQSYSLYLTHVPVLMLLNNWKQVYQFGFWPFMALALVACIVASYLFYAGVERPSLALREWIVKRGETPRPARLPLLLRPLGALSLVVGLAFGLRRGPETIDGRAPLSVRLRLARQDEPAASEPV